MKRLSTRLIRDFFVATALTGLTACSQSVSQTPAASDSLADTAAIRATETQFNKDFNAHDLEAVVEHYAHDAVVMNPGVAPTNGSDAIRAALTPVLTPDSKFQTSFAGDRIGVAASGDLAYAAGKYTNTVLNPKTHAMEHQTGGYVTVYHKAANGDWKAVADISTPGPVPTAPAAP